MASREQLKQKIHEKIREYRKKKQTEGKVNIENVSAPKKHKPKKHKEEHSKAPQPGAVSVGAHGGRYIQEPSGHKRYVAEGQLSGRKRYKKSLQESIGDILVKSEAEEFVKQFKQRRK